MQPRNTPALSLKDVLLWSLLLPAVAGALQQQPYDAALPSKAVDRALSVADERYQAQDSLRTPLTGQRQGGYRDTDVEYDKDRQRAASRSRTRTPPNERALATYAPAESAVGAPPAPRSATSTAGLTSRQPARSLQDWQVEDIILLATVDGKLHARDRTTGAARWQLEVDRPMVETVYHRHNKSVDENGLVQEDPLWIVEPSQDGSIYVYAPSSGYGMQKLGKTVKELADASPYAGEGQLAVAYAAEKKTTLYTIDAGTGNVLKVFSATGSISNQDRSCRRVNPLESLDEECEPIGTLTLGRTEYTVAIQDRTSAEQIATIKYFEWGPNNRDQDLRSQYTSTMDRKYVYTRHDGSFFGLNLGDRNDYRPVPANKPAEFREKFSSPVARVYDVVRALDDQSNDASLVVLPQPIGPSWNDFAGLEDDAPENVFVNCTESGSWYALSETNYPAVTDGAPEAQCYGDDYFGLPDLPMSKASREKFMGLHQLYAPQTLKPGIAMIGAPDYPGIDAPPVENKTRELTPTAPAAWNLPSVRTLVLAMMVGLAGTGLLYRQKLGLSSGQPLSIRVPQLTETIETQAPSQEQPETPKLREAEPAKEIIFPNAEDGVVDPAVVEDDEGLVRAESPEDAAEDDEALKDAKDGKAGKHKRGKRGGKKAKEKEQAVAEAKAKRKASQVPQPAEVISVAASESPQVAGPLQINSLIIHTDKVIGQGSCGTSVFEGSFEGRDVAVKRMLSQYYELASQEVSFLQQSDDHANVVRYFCQQKDDHFLYIAVELCQASLFEVWEPEKAKTEERHLQLAGLKHMIQQDTPRALQQLAAGLYHLHNLRIIHRDIKPQNILVAFPKRNQNNGPRLVISDFGLGKNLPENVSTLIDPTGNAGTSGWKAPELISQPRETDSKHSQSHSHNEGSASGTSGPSGVKRAADIFSLGCLFFWVLTDGIHPYEDENGWQQLRELNIKRDNKKMGVLERWSDAYEPMQLITSMLEHQPENRPTALQVLNHPFFWSPEKRLAFLCDCSDHFEREPRGIVEDGFAGDSYCLQLLEERAEEVIGAPYERADFLSKLDRHFVDTLGKQRKYSGNRLLDLLRALRNKKNHYEDMPEDVKKRVGPLAAGYLNYWSNRFPRLLMACYQVVHEAGVQGGDRFKGYLAVDS
ncbi:hypothetical protein LTR36_009633 [Oleoguttula mirabilis]|uniref:non-specific serine/threonine protein kinase n=1 Tax=Oleoguttula mirabilis TaxID=1507867 RepID=A0AAV9J627_9PEZI|nr:hypothetical protein LTR36_009633 [Oleoguttula mirabilis]